LIIHLALNDIFGKNTQMIIFRLYNIITNCTFFKIALRSTD